MVKTPVYLDHHATTPLDPRVLEVLVTAQRDHFGNPGSVSHALGWAAAGLVEQARRQVAELIGATTGEIIFTGGATEADNLALFGVAEAYREQGRHLVISALEHPAVAGPAAELEVRGWQVSRVPGGPDGIVDPAAVAAACRPDTVLVSVMAAQNEIGTLQPVGDIARLCRERGILFHTDAAQAAGKVPLDVQADGIALLTLSAHKLYGPKGVGALYVRRRDPRVTLRPQQFGGGQERGLRPGTANAPGIAAFGEACRLARLEMVEEGRRLAGLRDRLWAALRREIPDVRLNGCPRRRLPGNLNVSFPGVAGARLPGRLTTLAVSSGAACGSGDEQPSAVLKGLGLDAALAAASLRLGLGRFTTEAEVDYAAGVIVLAVRELGAD